MPEEEEDKRSWFSPVPTKIDPEIDYHRRFLGPPYTDFLDLRWIVMSVNILNTIQKTYFIQIKEINYFDQRFGLFGIPLLIWLKVKVIEKSHQHLPLCLESGFGSAAAAGIVVSV